MDVTFAALEGSVLSIEDSFLEVSTTTFDDQHNHEHQLNTSTGKMNEPNDEPAPVQDLAARGPYESVSNVLVVTEKVSWSHIS